ncbi:hypothetical protein ACFVJK_48330 [Streptomyces sp. NPDC127172]|uniref:hypothetical protein n=1 Tax=Streptomyces sp. NPDC127172 TaxID=3345382 RepID=UPI003626163C
MTTAPARPADLFIEPTAANVAPVVPVASGIDAEIATITPDKAREMLRRNTHNRPIREARVHAYTRLMTGGLWHLNGEAIKIATDGTILDGQHRLLAVVKSGITIKTLVVTGLPMEAQETMDGGAKRSTGDVFSLRGEQNSAMLASVARKVWLWDSGDKRFSSKESPSSPELAALLGQHSGLRRSADIAMRTYQTFRCIPPSIVGAAHHLASRIAPDDATWFFQRLGDGAELSLRHPVLTLRTKAMADKDARREVTDGRHMAHVMRAWNAVRDGKTLAVIQIPADDPVVEPK